MIILTTIIPLAIIALATWIFVVFMGELRPDGPTRRACQILWLIPLIQLALIGSQYWLDRLAGEGELGRTPIAAVLLPFLAWCVLALVLLVDGVHRMRKRRRPIAPILLALLLTIPALFISYRAIESLLAVI